MAPLLFVPALALKPLLMVMAVGGAVVGWLGGRQSAEIAAQGEREARRQAEIARLRAENQALAARLQATAPVEQANGAKHAAIPPPAPGKSAPDATKTSFLKRILQANLTLRASPKDPTGDPPGG